MTVILDCADSAFFNSTIIWCTTIDAFSMSENKLFTFGSLPDWPLSCRCSIFDVSRPIRPATESWCRLHFFFLCSELPRGATVKDVVQVVNFEEYFLPVVVLVVFFGLLFSHLGKQSLFIVLTIRNTQIQSISHRKHITFLLQRPTG
jgi:hypothetical protein